MEKNEIANVLLLLNKAYPGRAPLADDDIFTIWYECFKNEKYQKVYDATIAQIKVNTYCPTIAEIAESLEMLKQAEHHNRVKITRLYDSIVNRWGAKRDKTLDVQFWELIKHKDLEIAVVRANYVHTKAYEYIDRMEQDRIDTGREYVGLMPFDKWLAELSTELKGKDITDEFFTNDEDENEVL